MRQCTGETVNGCYMGPVGPAMDKIRLCGPMRAGMVHLFLRADYLTQLGKRAFV